MWLVKCLKSLVLEYRSTVIMLNGVKKRAKTLPSYCFIALAKIELENVGLSVSEILGVFVNTMTADKHYSVRNRKNFSQPIQLQLFKIRKFFSHFFVTYLKSTCNFEHFERKKRRLSNVMYFRN